MNREEIEKIIIDNIPLTNEMYKDEEKTILVWGTILPRNKVRGVMMKITNTIISSATVGIDDVWLLLMRHVPFSMVIDDQEGGTGEMSLGIAMTEDGIKKYAKEVAEKIIEINR